MTVTEKDSRQRARDWCPFSGHWEMHYAKSLWKENTHTHTPMQDLTCSERNESEKSLLEGDQEPYAWPSIPHLPLLKLTN